MKVWAWRHLTADRWGLQPVAKMALRRTSELIVAEFARIQSARKILNSCEFSYCRDWQNNLPHTKIVPGVRCATKGYGAKRLRRRTVQESVPSANTHKPDKGGQAARGTRVGRHRRLRQPRRAHQKPIALSGR